MRRFIHLLVLLCLLGSGFASSPVSAAQSSDILDLADVPLPVQALPEAGYQVLAGDYLDGSEVVSLIADARNLEQPFVADEVENIGIARTYVLDLVLPEDRAWQQSPVLAVQQTSVYLLNDESAADSMADLLNDHSSTKFVTEKTPAVEDATTVATIGESGDMLRTVVSDGRVVIEVVSMDATGAPDETEHILIVEGTLARLQDMRNTSDAGLSPAALTLVPVDMVSSFTHTQQSGFHGLYRLRDGQVQPAIGELNAGETAVPQGMDSLYLSNTIAYTGGGGALISLWLSEFDSGDAATAFFDTLVSDSPAAIFSDPYFLLDGDESWTAQNEAGVYRVSGTWQMERYSGYVEIRVSGDTIVVIGYRSIGAALPNADITSALMDHQLACIDSGGTCAPFDLAAASPPATVQASPVADGGTLGSSEFGWSLPDLGADWTITERFAEPGYDRIGLQNGVSMFEIESLINHHGEPMQCVLDELHLLQEFEERADIRLWEDENGNTEGGSTPTSAWVVYRVEPLVEERADQEYVIRIDCFTLITGSANVVIRHIAPVDVWPEEAPKGDILRDGLVLPETFAAHAKLATSAHDRRMDMIHAHWADKTA